MGRPTRAFGPGMAPAEQGHGPAGGGAGIPKSNALNLKIINSEIAEIMQHYKNNDQNLTLKYKVEQ